MSSRQVDRRTRVTGQHSLWKWNSARRQRTDQHSILYYHTPLSVGD